jgi:NADH-quinone oxidoreductase subunit G
MSPATVKNLGIDSAVVTVVGAARGTVSLPLAITPGMIDGVVWVPKNSPGSTVASSLGVLAGEAVTVKGSGS